MLTLRGHHLLCSLNYSGSGYTEGFIANFNAFCTRATKGEKIRLTWQPDTICQPMLGHASCHCRRPTIPVRDFLGFLATSIVLKKWMFPPRTVTLTPADVAKLRAAFRSGASRAGCLGCEWFGHCSRTAQSGWPKSKLFPLTKPRNARKLRP